MTDKSTYGKLKKSVTIEKNIPSKPVVEVNILDKYEFQLKLDEIESLVNDKNYAKAAELADTINWRKVRNISTLMMIGEVYQQTKRYEDCKDILLSAYERSPIGKKIIYRLAEIAIEAGQLEEAKEYYDEFVDIAPHDSGKYVLRYRISQAKKEPYTEQIKILNDFKDQEYTEEWAYELAYLYHKAGMTDKCIESCDELILWFGDGPYVEKALELKMLYQPLSPEQEEKYKEFRRNRSGIIEVRPQEQFHSGEIVTKPLEIPEVQVNAGILNTQNLQEEIAKGIQQIMEATEKETVSDTMDSIKKLVEDIPYLQPLLQDEPAGEPEPDYETDAEIDRSINLNFQELLAEESDGQISMSLPQQTAIERQITGQLTIEDILAEWEKTKRAAEAAMEDAQQRKLESAKAKALHEAEDMMERLSAVIPQLDAGATTKELVEQAYENPTGETVEAAVGAMQSVNAKLQEEIDRLSATEEETADIDFEQSIVSNIESEIQAELQEKHPEQTTGEPEPEEEAAAEIGAEPEGEAALDAKLQAVTEHAAPHVTREIERPELMRATKEFPDLTSILKKDPFQSKASELVDPDILTNTEQTAEKQFKSVGEEVSENSASSIENDASTESAGDGTDDSIAKVMSDWELIKNMPKDPTTPLPEIDLDVLDEIEIKPGKKFQPIKKLEPAMAEDFSYFMKVDQMENRICKALNECAEHMLYTATSDKGNLIIEGAAGCGKTKIATCFVKALETLTEKKAKQVGKINGDVLNHKDIASVMGKISGECLIIEHAGEISKETAMRLASFLAGDLKGTFVILEDDRDGIKKALSKDEKFAACFTSQIVVPYFTNDELVEFAITYAKEMGYTIENMALLALHTKINNIQRLDEATTLVEVKEIVDEAIDRAERGGIKKVFGIITARRYDEEDYIVLREKDFKD